MHDECGLPSGKLDRCDVACGAAPPPFGRRHVHFAREDTSEMRQIVEAARKSNGGDGAVSRPSRREQSRGLPYAFLEYAARDRLVVRGESPCQRTARDPHVPCDRTRCQLRVSELEGNHLTGTGEQGGARGLSRGAEVALRFIEKLPQQLAVPAAQSSIRRFRLAVSEVSVRLSNEEWIASELLHAL